MDTPLPRYQLEERPSKELVLSPLLITQFAFERLARPIFRPYRLIPHDPGSFRSF